MHGIPYLELEILFDLYEIFEGVALELGVEQNEQSASSRGLLYACTWRFLRNRYGVLQERVGGGCEGKRRLASAYLMPMFVVRGVRGMQKIYRS